MLCEKGISENASLEPTCSSGNRKGGRGTVPAKRRTNAVAFEPNAVAYRADATADRAKPTAVPINPTAVPANPTAVSANPTAVPANITAVPANITAVPAYVTEAEENAVAVETKTNAIGASTTAIKRNTTLVTRTATAIMTNPTASEATANGFARKAAPFEPSTGRLGTRTPSSAACAKRKLVCSRFPNLFPFAQADGADEGVRVPSTTNSLIRKMTFWAAS